MAPDKLTPNDPRASHHTASINGKTYHYLLANPPSPPRDTILLIHGWPDLSFGWRYQVPFLLSLGLRVVVPDMVGYGRTDAPADLAAYSYKTAADDVVALAAHVTLGDATAEPAPFLLGGHDWGGTVVWRVALWHPRLVRAVFSICTPYQPPQRTYLPLEDMVVRLPNFRYQVHLAGPEVEARVVGRPALRAFTNGLFGGRTPEGGVLFDTSKGVLLENLDKVGQSPLLSPEESDYYADEYARHGDLRGPLNWYRTRKVNYEEELELAERGARITAPALFVLATKDNALPPWLGAKMDVHFDNLVRGEVESTHWALVEAAEKVNEYIGGFLQGILGTGEEGKAKI